MVPARASNIVLACLVEGIHQPSKRTGAPLEGSRYVEEPRSPMSIGPFGDFKISPPLHIHIIQNCFISAAGNLICGGLLGALLWIGHPNAIK